MINNNLNHKIVPITENLDATDNIFDKVVNEEIALHTINENNSEENHGNSNKDNEMVLLKSQLDKNTILEIDSPVKPLNAFNEKGNMIKNSFDKTLQRQASIRNRRRTTLFSHQDKHITELLLKYDKDGDGNFGIDEVMAIVEEVDRDEKQIVWLKHIVVIVIIAILLLLIIQSLLTAWVIELTKDMGVSGSKLIDSKSKTMIQTDKPLSYITILDISKQSPIALQSLKELTFTTDNNEFHSYSVIGSKFDLNSIKPIEIIFSNTKSMLITNTTAVLRSVDYYGHIFDVGVVIPEPISSGRRLKSLLNDHSTLINSDLYSRCSKNKAFCYHTYDEMKYLHQPVYINDRRLQEEEVDSSITYALLEADTSILMNGLSAMSSASTFIEDTLGAGTIKPQGTTILSFTMKERCVNYPELADVCKTTVAPYISDDEELIDLIFPYIGTFPSESKWYFRDIVEYSIDINTVRVKVRYSHDPLNARRQFVILMDRNNADKPLVTYEEVESSEPEVVNACYLNKKTPQDVCGPTFITNYKSDELLENIDGFEDGNIETSRKLFISKTIHDHIRNTRLKGFPNIHILEEFIGVDIKSLPDDHHIRRRLAEEDIVQLDSELTNSDTVGHVDISNRTWAKEQGLIKNETQFDEVFKGRLTKLPIDMTNLTSRRRLTEEYDEDIETNMEEPRSIFDSVDLTYDDKMIQWPVPSDSLEIDEFNSIEVLKRHMLNEHAKAHSYINETDTIEAQRRRLNTKVSAKSEANRLLFEKNIDDLYSTLNEFQNHIQLLKQSNTRDSFYNNNNNNNNKDNHNTNFRRNLRSAQLASYKKYRNMIPLYEFPMNKSTFIKVTGGKLKELGVDMAGEAFDNLVEDKLNAGKEFIQQSFTYKTRPICTNTKTEIIRLNDNIQFFVYESLEAIHDAGEMITSSIEDVNILSLVLSDLEKINNVLKILTKSVLGKIPVVGVVVRIFSSGLDRTVNPAIRNINNGLQNLIKSIEKNKVESNIEKIDEKNVAISTRMTKIQDSLKHIDNLIIVDALCPTLVKKITEPACFEIQEKTKFINDELDNFKDELSSFKSFLTNQLDYALAQIASFTKSSLWKVASPIISSIQPTIDKLVAVLNYKISACISGPFCSGSTRSCFSMSYPCGVRWCRRWGIRYPCGLKWCSKNVCVTIYYPVWCKKCISFSIMDIMDGLMRATSFLEGIINAGVNAIISKLGITLPKFNLPGLPNLSFAIDMTFQFPPDLLNLLNGVIPPLSYTGYSCNSTLAIA